MCSVYVRTSACVSGCRCPSVHLWVCLSLSVCLSMYGYGSGHASAYVYYVHVCMYICMYVRVGFVFGPMVQYLHEANLSASSKAEAVLRLSVAQSLAQSRASRRALHMELACGRPGTTVHKLRSCLLALRLSAACPHLGVPS